MADRFQRLGLHIARKRFYKIGKSLEAVPHKENRYRRLKEGLRGVIEEDESCSPF